MRFPPLHIALFLILLLIGVTMNGSVECQLDLAREHHAAGSHTEDTHPDAHGGTIPHLGGHAHCFLSLLPLVMFFVIWCSWRLPVLLLPCGPAGFLAPPFIPPRHSR